MCDIFYGQPFSAYLFKNEVKSIAFLINMEVQKVISENLELIFCHFYLQHQENSI